MGAESRFLFDTLSAVLLFLTALVGAYCPRYLASKDGVQNGGKNAAFHLGNMLSAGVMLSAGFCHLLADSLRNLSFTGRFPTATFLAALGYIITLLADQIVHIVADSSSDAAASSSSARPSDGADMHRYQQLRHKGTPGDSPQADKPSSPEVVLAGECELRNYGNGMQHRQPALHQLHAQHLGQHSTASSHHTLEMDGQLPLLNIGHGTCNGSSAPLAGVPPPGTPSGGAGGHSHDCHSAHLKVFLTQRPLSFMTTVLLAGALCVHSILEGMALGAQQSMKDTEDIMIAIAAHKGLAAYALGASIVESNASSSKFWTVITIFASATPVGIFMGFIFSEVSSGAGAAAMSALASGTFFYVAVMEVIPKELADPTMRVPKMLMLLLGFGLMSLLAVWA